MQTRGNVVGADLLGRQVVAPSFDTLENVVQQRQSTGSETQGNVEKQRKYSAHKHKDDDSVTPTNHQQQLIVHWRSKQHSK